MMQTFVKQIQFNRALASVRLTNGEVAANIPQDQPQSTGATNSLSATQATLEAESNSHPDQLFELIYQIKEQIEELETRRGQSLEELQLVAVELAMLAATHVLERAVQADEYPIGSLVSRAVSRLETSRTICIRLHPDDLHQLNQIRNPVDDSSGSERTAAGPFEEWADRVQFLADSTLQRGTCWADGGDYGLLSTLEERILDVRQCFTEGIDDAQVERRATATEDQTVRRFPDRRETA